MYKNKLYIFSESGKNVCGRAGEKGGTPGAKDSHKGYAFLHHTLLLIDCVKRAVGSYRSGWRLTESDPAPIKNNISDPVKTAGFDSPILPDQILWIHSL